MMTVTMMKTATIAMNTEHGERCGPLLFRRHDGFDGIPSTEEERRERETVVKENGGEDNVPSKESTEQLYT